MGTFPIAPEIVRHAPASAVVQSFESLPAAFTKRLSAPVVELEGDDPPPPVEPVLGGVTTTEAPIVRAARRPKRRNFLIT